jgi:hypothetical protein
MAALHGITWNYMASHGMAAIVHAARANTAPGKPL